MRLSEILKPGNIRVPLEAKSKADAITELTGLLAASGDAKDPKKLLEAVMERESTRTTGIGAGLAIPHGKTSGVDKLTLAIGKCATPVDFQSIDGRPVSVIWLLASPPDQTVPHIHALGRVSKLWVIDKFRAALLNATTADEVYQAIVAQESSM